MSGRRRRRGARGGFSIGRFFWRFLLLLILGAGLYVGAGYGLGAFRVSGPAQADEAGDRIRVYVISNGYHAGLVLPLRAGGIDWASRFPPSDFAAPPADPTHVVLGWGEREFYMNTRTLSDLDPWLAVRALFGLGSAVMHVELTGEPSANARAIDLGPSAYRRLSGYVTASFASAGRFELIPGKGYGSNDAFYAGTGRYSPVMTCNEWLGRGLRAAGVPTGLWTPFASSLLAE